jgi:hypothetical protein
MRVETLMSRITNQMINQSAFEAKKTKKAANVHQTR